MKRRGGFNAMDPARAKEIQSLGGKAAHAKGVAPKWNSETGRKAGKKGGGKNSEVKRIRKERYQAGCYHQFGICRGNRVEPHQNIECKN